MTALVLINGSRYSRWTRETLRDKAGRILEKKLINTDTFESDTPLSAEQVETLRTKPRELQ